MKHLMSILVAALAFFVACTETAPVEISELGDATRQTATKAILLYQRIPFDVVLSANDRDDSEVFEVNGSVHYLITVEDIERWSVVQLYVITSGVFRRYQQDGPQWRFSGSSFDEVIVSR